MGKRVMVLGLALALLFPSLACICLPTGLRLPTGIKETATAIVGGIEEVATELATIAPEEKTPTVGPEETGVPSVAGCFADLPEYPGAKRDKEKEAELESWIGRLGPEVPLVEGEGRIYITADPLKEVIRFYEKEMPERGWERKLALTSDEGGIMLWERGGFAASFIIGKIEEENLIVITCNLIEAMGPPTGATPRFYAGPDISEDGVELTNFSVEGPEAPRVGDALVVRFKVRNTTGAEMKFSPFGILVGCRDPDDENRDFGHTEETILKPDEVFEFEAKIEVDKPGLWHFWPGYYLGHWGPYKWQEIRVEVK